MSTTNEEYIWKCLYCRIKNAYGTAGLIGNLYAESGLRPNILEGKYKNKLGFTSESYTKAVDEGTYSNFVHDSAGYGLAQWTHHSRKEALLKFASKAGTSIGDLDMQLDFLFDEIKGFKGVMNTLTCASSVKEASDIVMLKYEIPADRSKENQQRRALIGQKYFDMYARNWDVINMGNATQEIINIAVQEEGYLEKKSVSDLDDKTANAGSGNYTKYARDLDAVSWFNGKKQGSAWCSVFVSWCFYRLFGRDLGKRILFQPDKDNCAAGCSSAAKYFKKMGQFYQTPEPGDQIFFESTSGDGYSHTGLVERVDENKVHTIEGNTSSTSDVVPNGGAVRRKSYDINNSRIAGYGRPDWGIVSDKPIDGGDGKDDDVEEFKAKVIADSGKTVNIRASASTNSKILARANIGDYVLAACRPGDEWARVEYVNDSGEIIGYVMTKFLERVPEGADEQGDDNVIVRVELTEIEALVSEALVKIQNLEQRLGGDKNVN